VGDGEEVDVVDGVEVGVDNREGVRVDDREEVVAGDDSEVVLCWLEAVYVVVGPVWEAAKVGLDPGAAVGLIT
jgi:hypothetical protein